MNRHGKSFRAFFLLSASALFILAGCQNQEQPFQVQNGEIISKPAPEAEDPEHGEHHHETGESYYNDGLVIPFACTRPSSSQLSLVNKGNIQYEHFMRHCRERTNNSEWCVQLTRPNPSSLSTFRCTYGYSQPHLFIHPDERTWNYAYQAVNLVEELEAMGIDVALIYNWWRPEPYNRNVGGAAGRHPYGTSVDVRFASMSHMYRAHTQLCKWRRQGRIRAVGFYGSTGLHFGIGDYTANTWGKSCP